MINTRLSIFKSLKSIIREMTRHGEYNSEGFRDIMYGVILSDMKEWSEYISTDDNKKLVDILNNYILEHKDFKIERFVDEPDLYKNVNTPLDNTTWIRIEDIPGSVKIESILLAVKALPDCAKVTYNSEVGKYVLDYDDCNYTDFDVK